MERTCLDQARWNGVLSRFILERIETRMAIIAELRRGDMSKRILVREALA
jgi:hypothetical protein